ncbi:MAG TPA: hypothetical protein VLV88_05670 [Terriglobales bacterium]|nr:hypothetical protein [Terriglobales bacterium]
MHLAAFEGAKESYGDAGGFGDLRKRQRAALAEPPKAQAMRNGVFRGRGDDSLALKDVNDGSGIEPAGAAKKNGTLKKANVVLRKEAVAAPGTERREEAKGFPGAKRGGGNADAASDFADAKEALRRALR